MTAKKNGWGRIAFITTTIVAVFGAVAILDPWVPWAPKEEVSANFVMAAENTLDRHHSLVIKLTFLIEQAKNSGDQASEASWRKQLLDVQAKIKDLETEKVRRK